MKHARKILSLLLALAMVFAMAAPAWADDTTTTPKGSITIQGTGQGGDKVSVAGKTFNAYKILDVELVPDSTGNTGQTSQNCFYTVPSEMKDFYQTRYNLTGSEVNFDALVVEKIKEESDMYAFAAAALAAAKTANTEEGASAPTPTGTATADADVASVTISDLPLGYYVIEDAGTATPISALILDTTNPDVTVNIKADKPSVDKKIDGDKDTDEGTTGDVESNNAAVGDKVPYKVTSNVPDMTGYTKYYFVLNDTLSKGLTFNDDVVIKIGETELTTVAQNTDGTKTYTSKTYQDGEAESTQPDPYYYTVTKTTNDETGETTVEIVFNNFIQHKGNAGKPITITYSATVNSDAVIGTQGNSNKVTLTYSNNPNVKDDGDPENPDKPAPNSPVGETPESTTRTYVTDIELIKVDNEGDRLTGAEFKIEGTKLNTVLMRTDIYTVAIDGEYWKLKDGSYTMTAPVTAEGETDTSQYYESTTTKYTKSVGTTTIEKAENVTYTGTVGADGVLRFEGLSAGTYTITEIKAPSGYNLLKDPITVTIGFTAPAGNSTDCTWTYTGTDVVNGTNTNKVTVINQAGAELPSTGGAGTALFYIVGGILAVGAAVLLVTKRRMRNEDE